MAINPEVKVRVTADAGPYQRTMQQAATATGKVDKSAASLQTRTDKLGASFAKQAAAYGASAIAFAGAVGVMRDSIMAATELQDSTSKIEVVFGSASQAIVDFADDSTRSFGLSRRAAYDATSTFAIFGKAAGLAGRELTDWSIDLSQRAVDLSSMFGGTVEEAITAVGAALRGEMEPIRRYGALLDDATLRQRALEMGLISTTKNALDPQTRALVAAQEVLRQTDIASGDYMNTIDGMANSLKEASKQWEDAKAAFGEAVLPAATTATKAGAGGLTWISRWFGDMTAGMAANVALLTGNTEAYDNAMGRLRGTSEAAASSAAGAADAVAQVGANAGDAAADVSSLVSAMNNLVDAQQAAAGASRDLLGASDRIRAGMVQGTSSAGGAASASKAASKAAQEAIDAIRKQDAAEEEKEIKAARRAMQRRADARADAKARRDVEKGIADAIALDKRARAGKNISGVNKGGSVGEYVGSLNKRETKQLEAQIDAIRKKHEKSVAAQVKQYKAASSSASNAAGSVDVLSTSLNENTAAGRQNLDVLDGEIDAIQRAGQTAYDAAMEAGLGAEAATRLQVQVMSEARADLLQTYKSWGFNIEQVRAYIREIGLIPKKIETKIGIDSTQLAKQLQEGYERARALYDGLGRKINDDIAITSPSNPYENTAHAGSPTLRRAFGGEVYGPGTSTSDSIPARLSRGEYVVRASQYAANRELVRAINSGSGRVAGGAGVVIEGGVHVVAPSPMAAGENVIDALEQHAFRKGAVR